MKRIMSIFLALVMVVSFFATTSLSAVATSNTAAKFSFENTLSDSISMESGTGHGNYSYITGIEGNALYLDGSSYVSLPVEFSDSQSEMTISAWIKGNQIGPCALLEAYNNNQLVMQITMPDEEGIVNWTMGTNLVRRLPEECFYQNDWNFWTFVFDGTDNKMHIYINGVITSTIADATNSVPNIDSLLVGGMMSSNDFFIGSLDELTFYNCALTTDEVQAAMRGERAYDPMPANGSSSIKENGFNSVSWSGNNGAISYDVYLSADYQTLETSNIESAAYLGNTTDCMYVLPELIEGTRYYWRIDTVYSNQTVKGQIWHFTPISWNATEYFAKGTEALTAIERDFRIPQYNGYFEENNSTAWSYIWPNSIHLMALAKIGRLHPEMYIPRINNYVDQLDLYRTTVNNITGYDCTGNPSITNRFYDDNAWMASALMDVYSVTGSVSHLNKAIDAYNFALSGEDSTYGGGIRWKETQYEGDPPVMKGISSTAGTSFAAIKLYRATGNPQYLLDSERLIGWILDTLQDEDGIILNSIDSSGINTVKWSYNTGITISALAMLYEETGDADYLNEALRMGKAAATMWIDTETGAIIDAGCFAFTLIDAWVALYELTDNIYWLELVAIANEHLKAIEDTNGRYPLNWQDAYGEQEYWGLLYSASVANAYLSAANCGATIVEPQATIPSELITATASSEWAGAGAANTINESGLTGICHDNSSTASTMWHTQSGGGGQANQYDGLPVGAAWIVYSFNKSYSLGRMSIWNFNQYGLTTRGLRNVSIYYSKDNITWTELGEYEFPQAAGSNNYPYNYQVDFNGNIAKYVAIIADVQNGNWGDSYYGLSEVRFEYDGSLIAMYSCNDGQGNTLSDNGPDENDATIVNGTWVGGALSLSGNSYVQMPSEILSGLDNSVTISLWVYNRNSDSSFLFEAANGAGNRVLGAHIPWYDMLYWDAGNADRVQKSIEPSSYVNQWIHWVFVKDATTGQQLVYKNGYLYASNTGCTQSLSGITTFMIGASVGGQNGYNGLIDDVRIYSSAFSAREVLDLYQHGSQ